MADDEATSLNPARKMPGKESERGNPPLHVGGKGWGGARRECHHCSWEAKVGVVPVRN
jgi:hypothetical protein